MSNQDGIKKMTRIIEVNGVNVAVKYAVSLAVKKATGFSMRIDILVSRVEWDLIQRCNATTDDCFFQGKEYRVSEIITRWVENGAILIEDATL